VHYLTILFTAFSVASAITHGNPETAIYEGNCFDGINCSEQKRQMIYDKLWGQCQAMGAKSMPGGFDGDGYHFKYTCTCVHGDTKLPFIYNDPDFAAEVTFGELCE
jgi:hypothetical protein